MTTAVGDKITFIAKLLNQAENAGTQEEAATFMAKAQHLATIHGVDLAKARYATQSKERTLPIQRPLTIGLLGDRGRTTLVDLFLGIADANDVQCTVANDNTRVYAHGFAEDVDVCEALYASLLVQQARFAAQYKADGLWQQEMVLVDGKRKPLSWLTARLNFQSGFASRISRRLAEAKREEIAHQRRLDEQRSADDAGTALVLAAKDEAIDKFYDETNPHLRRKNPRTYRGGLNGAFATGSRAAGHRAGDRASLGGNPSLPGNRQELTS